VAVFFEVSQKLFWVLFRWHEQHEEGLDSIMNGPPKLKKATEDENRKEMQSFLRYLSFFSKGLFFFSFASKRSTPGGQ
jgi:hypothetical protein